MGGITRIKETQAEVVERTVPPDLANISTVSGQEACERRLDGDEFRWITQVDRLLEKSVCDGNALIPRYAQYLDAHAYLSADCGCRSECGCKNECGCRSECGCRAECGALCGNDRLV